MTVVAARAKVAAAGAKGSGGKSSSGEGAAVAREHQLLGERMFRAALNVRVVARLRRVPIGRGAGASGSGHVGLYVLVVGLVHGLLTARAAHRRRGQDASCAAKGDSTVQCKLEVSKEVSIIASTLHSCVGFGDQHRGIVVLLK